MKQQSRLLLLLFWLIPSLLSAQSVGLVMSGGAAKGLAHIGVIKALEEHNIPIDYITGTSIGAIIGGLYAMGYSPDEMADLIRSDEFRFWLTGDVEPKYQYYFKTTETLPNYLRIGIDIKDSLQISPRLPNSLIPSAQMNYVFLRLFSQANAVGYNSFDNLFVPFRSVASNMNEKKAHVFRSGDLGDAVRASMSFPLVFKPITIDGNLMLDGGIYNNFPVSVMLKDFNPDYMIGSNVAGDPKEIDEKNVYSMLESMVVNRFDFPIPPGRGTTIKFQLNNISLRDFDKLDEAVQIGYERTIAVIDQIKQSVKREVTQEELSARRAAFREKLPELRFGEICLTESTELNKEQKGYIIRTMNKDGRTFDIAEFKKDYFKLLADKQIAEIIPRATYVSTDNLFELGLTVHPSEQLSVLFGGNISTGVANQTYIGLNYKGFSSYTYDLLVDGQFGRIYNAGRFIFRIDLPMHRPLYFKLTGNTHVFNHFASDRIFYEDNRQVSQYQRENYLKLNIGMPVKMSSLLEFGFTAGVLTDTYRRERFIYPDGKSDISTYDVTGISARYEANSLDDRQFPTTGSCRRYLA
ncbi:MAG: patatin-like phospholipase family protein, partial [Prevotellaceae bacterium]|nr:patatin-like phospholipase family protein [Prevotellaceae bacterium]